MSLISRQRDPPPSLPPACLIFLDNPQVVSHSGRKQRSLSSCLYLVHPAREQCDLRLSAAGQPYHLLSRTRIPQAPETFNANVMATAGILQVSSPRELTTPRETDFQCKKHMHGDRKQHPATWRQGVIHAVGPQGRIQVPREREGAIWTTRLATPSS